MAGERGHTIMLDLVDKMNVEHKHPITILLLAWDNSNVHASRILADYHAESQEYMCDSIDAKSET